MLHKFAFQIVLFIIIIFSILIDLGFSIYLPDIYKNISSLLDGLTSAFIISFIVSITIDLKKEEKMMELTSKQLTKLSRPLFNLSRYKTNKLKEDFLNKVAEITSIDQVKENYQLKIMDITPLENGKFEFDICIKYQVHNLTNEKVPYEFGIGFDPKKEKIEFTDNLKIGTRTIKKEDIVFNKNKKFSLNHLVYINKSVEIFPKKYIVVEYRIKQIPNNYNEVEYQCGGLQNGIKITRTEQVEKNYNMHETLFFKQTDDKESKSMGEFHKVFNGYILPNQGIFLNFEQKKR